MRSLTFYEDFNPLSWFDFSSFINFSLVRAASFLVPSFIYIYRNLYRAGLKFRDKHMVMLICKVI